MNGKFLSSFYLQMIEVCIKKFKSPSVLLSAVFKQNKRVSQWNRDKVLWHIRTGIDIDWVIVWQVLYVLVDWLIVSDRQVRIVICHFIDEEAIETVKRQVSVDILEHIRQGTICVRSMDIANYISPIIFSNL